MAVLAVAVLLLAYAYGGTFAAFGVGAGLFVTTALVIRSGLAAHSPMGWLNTQFGEGAKAPTVAVAGDSSTVTQRRDPRQESTQLVQLEANILAGLRKHRIYQASLRPQLLDLATALLAQQKRADAPSVREAIGEAMWPLLHLEPGQTASNLNVDVNQLRDLLTRMEGFV